MRKGKVLVIGLSAKNKNHIFRADEKDNNIVREDQVENFDQLIKEGYLELIEDSEAEAKKKGNSKK